MSFDFTIPLAQKDLLTRSEVNGYVVEEVTPIRLLPVKLQVCTASFRTQGPLFVLECFDYLYSCLRHADNINTDIKEDAWEVMLKATLSHANGLVEILGMTDLQAKTRSHHLQALKMNSYLLCQFIELFEADVMRQATAVVTKKGRKKDRRQTVVDGGHQDWEMERHNAVQALLQLVQLNIHRLWQPPVIEEEFINLVTGSCYRLLENPNTVKNKGTRDSIFHLLGVMIKKYNHGLGCRLKLLQLLQHFEHLASPLAQAVHTFALEFGATTMVSEMMREIGSLDGEDLVRDASATRAYSVFLIELSERIPALMLPNMCVLAALLDEEPYTMRNCVLSIMGEMVVHVLSEENVGEKEKATRDQFLDRLEDHIHDVNAFVRSKTLQIWMTIVNEKMLPLPRQHRLLELVIGRLEDRSSQVRRNAIQLVTALLSMNPFAAKLPLEELRASYRTEKEKLDEMMPTQPDTPVKDPSRHENEGRWERMKEDLLAATKTALEVSGEDGVEQEELIALTDDVHSVCKHLVELLCEDKYPEAVTLFLTAGETWPNEDVFKYKRDGEKEEEEEEDGDDGVATCLLQKLRQLVLGDSQETDLERAVAMASSGSADAPTQDASIVNELTKQQVLVQYLKDSTLFASEIERAVPVVCQLLGSRVTTDVLEAVNFFVSSFEFGVSHAIVGVRQMLALVWSKEPTIKESVVNAYKRLYLKTDGSVSSRAVMLSTANNLLQLAVGATLGELTSLEQLVGELVKSGNLDNGVIQVLWEKFAHKIDTASAMESRGAILLLGMAATAEVEIVRSNIDVLVKEGLGPRAEDDYGLAVDTCTVLLKLAARNKAKVGTATAKPFKFLQQHKIFERLSHLIVTGVGRLDQSQWIPMAEQAVCVIYALAEHPDAICSDIIKHAAEAVLSYHQQGEPPEASQATPDVSQSTPDATQSTPEVSQSTPEEPQPTRESTPVTLAEKDSQADSDVARQLSCPPGVLTHLLSLAGHVALRHLVHLDVSIFGEMKRRRRLQEDSGKKNTPSSVRRTPRTEAGHSTAEEDLGMAGVVAEDAEAEFIRRVTEEELVTGNNLLAVLSPLITAVCNNPTKCPDEKLQSAASLTLAKYMLVSSQFCETHLQLLFTILEKSPSAVIRANTIITLGDLTFRFPNLIEPWTPNLYARLRDNSPQVRKNTLMVLTHLILNDMVKVKGQISELATCIIDEDSRIASLAKLFFNELSKKGNAIYNIMADMISRLSDPDVGIAEEDFRTIMRFLFSFIQKDKQCESLVEKLCHRFRATQMTRQWRDIAFCLSLLSYSDKALHKLTENMGCFADKLGDDDIYACFCSIVSAARKFAKAETKLLADEFEDKLGECRDKGVDNDAATRKATKASSAAARLGAKGKTPGGGRGTARRRKKASRRQRVSSHDDEGSDDVSQEIRPPRRTTRNKPAQPAAKLSFSSDESDVELFDV